MSPQLQWCGKIENSEFDVETVSLHVHERIDPHTILEKVLKPRQTETLVRYFDLPENNPPLRDAIKFYKHDQNWSNRMIAGDSLIVMNSLLEKEAMTEKVQMVYIDPPYGIEYGSNFQPFVSKRSVRDCADEDLTREPEMIKAFRDIWALKIHSYLTYMKERLLLARQLLNNSGSCIVQISIKNLALIKLIMDEVFGSENFVNIITVQKTSSTTSKKLDSVADYLVWYAKKIEDVKYHDLFVKKDLPVDDMNYRFLEFADGTRRKMTKEERRNPLMIPKGARIMMYDNLTSKSGDGSIEFEFESEIFTPRSGSWKTSIDGLNTLAKKKRIAKNNTNISYVRYFDDFPYRTINNVWLDVASSFMKKTYVVQTNPSIIERCMLMTTDPGDLVIDPTCGAGTTAYVAEKLGRRWITCDTSRVALILAKSRLMASTFEYYNLYHPSEGISSGFEYETARHITLSAVANNKPPYVETLYNTPKIDKSKTRITGPFTVEAVPSPTIIAVDQLYEDGESTNDDSVNIQQEWRDEIYKCGIRAKGGRKIEFVYVEPHRATRWIHALAETKDGKSVSISFGPKHAPLEQRQVELALEEARALVPKPDVVVFVAMQFDPEAAKDIDETRWPGTTLLKAEMSKDLLTKGLRKKKPQNESFWLVGRPDVELKMSKQGKYVVQVRGFDYYNIKTGKLESGGASQIAMWMLDEDYDGRSVYPQQIFFPMEGTEGWDKLHNTLKAHIDERLIVRYKGTQSIPFEAGFNERAAVKIIDDRGIESLRIIELK